MAEMTTVLDSFVRDAEEAQHYLRLSLSGDPHALRQEAQTNLLSFMQLLGRQLVHVPGTTAPEFVNSGLVMTAARHAGNDILDRVGEQQQLIQRCLRDFKDPDERHYAEDVACSLVEELCAHWYVQRALEAYRDAAEEDSDERDYIDQSVNDFKTIAKVYADGLTGNADGVKMLSWVAHNTNYVSNLRAMLPEGAEVPWFMNVDNYRQ
jgi:hypothetical protein